MLGANCLAVALGISLRRGWISPDSFSARPSERDSNGTMSEKFYLVKMLMIAVAAAIVLATGEMTCQADILARPMVI